jgi:hypothetical protein
MSDSGESRQPIVINLSMGGYSPPQVESAEAGLAAATCLCGSEAGSGSGGGCRCGSRGGGGGAVA